MSSSSPTVCRGYAACCDCARCQALESELYRRRRQCVACRGDREHCSSQNPSCQAYKPDGTLRATPVHASETVRVIAVGTPRQPWEPRPARAAA